MQLHTLFVCLKLPTEKPFSRRIFLWPPFRWSARRKSPWVFCGTQIKEKAMSALRSSSQERSAFVAVSTIALLFLAGIAFAQADPGVQSDNRGTGATIITSDPNGFLPFFTDGQGRFQELENVSNAANVGL